VACGQGIYSHHLLPDGGGEDGADAEPVPPTADAVADAIGPPLDGSQPSTTVTVDWQGGDIVTGDARLIIPKDVLASADDITLAQVSADGTLPGYRGAVGPVFTISKSAVFQRQARFELKLTPDPSMPVSRLALAYIDPKAHLWLILSDSSYDASTGLLSAVVNEFSSPWTVGPVLRCNSLAECGSGTTCQGGVCQ
jgi:hypothetical protein